MAKRAGEKRITIVPAIHGKLTYDRKISEPDVAWIIEKWLERHPDVDDETLATYHEYLANSLVFPFTAEHGENTGIPKE